MNYDKFLDFVTRTYGKPSITSRDRFAPEGSKKFTALTEFGLVSYDQTTGIVTVNVNGHLAAQYAIQGDTTMERCPICGSTAQFKVHDILVCDTYVEITYTCGCGVTTVTRLTKEQFLRRHN